MKKYKRPDRDLQLDMSSRGIVKKERVSRNAHLSGERDNFSCPSGSMIRFGNREDLEFGVQIEECHLAKKLHKYNSHADIFYGEES